MNIDMLKHIGFSLVRLITVLVIAAVVFYFGIVIGYSVIGSGKASEIMNAAAWKNFFSLFG
ncbi:MULTISPECIES: DNA-directed RNA polymerase subunit beta [unclassified Enterococcus]|uniref:DNA-directed RNA polymerase subunit beta n=1 Tax=unclassified Enterococcus TaxID=2608891 RepID=UPI001551EE4B|nr:MULTISPECIES: DNA-directed RNA polymerase subunit beta [unclassified Enterococcus]MBS7577225.1 DNA-directed RNA polymerase subunit beta [Enterococcus sp. MMGLQ5-2]MBS7584682.1 DNA-directed RNA polymerase subunit beta [Enterococcus sp. MMGLQ5-1]NPD12537.1 DNA-directed RNA polymerase subunit beta [Enterococcus sp. MMGLQ5-1]NPD37059.1 DNA-directed RNA polymerase subunit beta [Enterococcus sp. MMGLQ5-2]